MEQAKLTEPKFSHQFKELAKFLATHRQSEGCDTMSRFSSVGESFIPVNDHMSCMTGGFHNRQSFTKMRNDETMMSEKYQESDRHVINKNDIQDHYKERNCKSREVAKRSKVFNIQQNDLLSPENDYSSPSPLKPHVLGMKPGPESGIKLINMKKSNSNKLLLDQCPEIQEEENGSSERMNHQNQNID